MEKQRRSAGQAGSREGIADKGRTSSAAAFVSLVRHVGLLLTHTLLSALHPHAQTKTEVKATKEEMDKAQIDLSLRDACAHLLIPLNK